MSDFNAKSTLVNRSIQHVLSGRWRICTYP